MDCIFKIGDRVRMRGNGPMATVMEVKGPRIKVLWDYQGPDYDWTRKGFVSMHFFETENPEWS